MAIDVSKEMNAWFLSEETRSEITLLVRGAVRDEFRAVLDEELLDTRQAAELLNMKQSALRKAVERGQIRCERIGRRLRFRRSVLLEIGAVREAAGLR